MTRSIATDTVNNWSNQTKEDFDMTEGTATSEATEATTDTTAATATAPAVAESKDGPYVRVERSNRVTKATIGVYDSQHPDSVFEKKGEDRWVTFCVTHNAIQYSPSISKAWKFHASPWDFCAGCAEIKRAKDQAPAATPAKTGRRGRKAATPSGDQGASSGTAGTTPGPSGGRPVARPTEPALAGDTTPSA